MVSYDDEEAICDKTEYCINNDLNGFIIWEISGDVMQDLSTPLIDAMHAKLRDPSLDCKSLAYDPNAPPKATGLQNSISDQGVPTIAIPISAPTTPAPTMPLICPADHTGPLQHAACSGFYYCVNGNPYYPPIPCPEGMLFDESNSLCNLPARVTCSETLSPISAPTNMPTREPTVNLPIYSPPSSLADSTLTCSEGFTGPLPYNDCAEYYYCMNGNPYYPTIRCPPGTIFDENYLTCYDSSRASCPNSAQIQNGSTNTGVTAGDTADSTPKATEDEEGIKNESFQYGGNSGGNNGNEEGVDENLSDQSNEDNDVAYNIGSNSEEQEGSTETLSGQNDNGNPDEAYDDTNKEETANPSASSEGDDSVHSSPASEPDIQSTSPPASAQDVSVQSDETPTTQNVCGVSFNVVTENCMFGLTVTTCNKGDPPCPKGQGCYENVQCGDQVSSSSSTNHVSTVENGSNTVDDKASDDVYENNDDVSLTIIMKLGDYPNDIGWSLIAFDGSINVAKPPGTYESLKPNATVYETISIPLSLWVNSIRLTLTISSISGNGLCCSNGLGYYKIYEGILEEGLPLAEGGEFEYYTSKTIVITDNGIVLILDDDPPVTVQNFTGQDLMDQDYTDNIVGTEQQVVLSEPSNDSTSPQPNLIDSPEQQKVSSSQTNMMNSPESFSPESFDLASFTQAKTQNETEENSKKSVLITVMISVIIVAFVIGSILLYTAQKRKIAKCDQSLAHFPDDNDSLDWSEHGAWNVGEDEIGEPKNKRVQNWILVFHNNLLYVTTISLGLNMIRSDASRPTLL